MPTFYCQECNKEVFRVRPRPVVKFCGPDCREQSESRDKPPKQEMPVLDLGVGCEHCATPLRSAYRTTKYCNEWCLKQAERARKYGLTSPQLRELRLRAVTNGCDICGAAVETDSRDFNIDHCHASGTVRGILCGNCNRGLGSFRDQPDLLRRAAAYLEESTNAPDPEPLRL